MSRMEWLDAAAKWMANNVLECEWDKFKEKVFEIADSYDGELDKAPGFGAIRSRI